MERRDETGRCRHIKLRQFLQRSNMTHQELADAIGVLRPTVALYLSGERVPTPEVMARIQEVTAGAVRPEDFKSPPTPTRRR